LARNGRRTAAPKRSATAAAKLAAGAALVAHDRFAAAQRERQQPERDLTFLWVGGSEDRGARGAVRGAAQMQAHAPKRA
jgi:hypothetical protein